MATVLILRACFRSARGVGFTCVRPGGLLHLLGGADSVFGSVLPKSDDSSTACAPSFPALRPWRFVVPVTRAFVNSVVGCVRFHQALHAHGAQRSSFPNQRLRRHRLLSLACYRGRHDHEIWRGGSSDLHLRTRALTHQIHIHHTHTYTPYLNTHMHTYEYSKPAFSPTAICLTCHSWFRRKSCARRSRVGRFTRCSLTSALRCTTACCHCWRCVATLAST